MAIPAAIAAILGRAGAAAGSRAGAQFATRAAGPAELSEVKLHIKSNEAAQSAGKMLGGDARKQFAQTGADKVDRLNRSFEKAGIEADRGAGKWDKLRQTFLNVNQQAAYVNYNVHSAIGKISSIPAKFGQHLTFAIDALAAAAAPFANLVGQANPAMITQFSLAVRDAYGTLGQQLVPVMRTFTDVARKIGNMFAGMQGTLEPAFRGIKSFVESVGNTLTRVLKDRAPLIQYLATAIERTAKMAAVAIDLFFRLADVIVKPAMRLLKLLEFDGGFDASKSAVGAGFRSVKTVSASKEIADEAIKGALMAGIGQQQYERPESYLKTIAEKATAIEDWLKRNKLPTSNKEVAKELRTGDGVSAAGAASASPTYNLYRTQKRR